MRCCFHSFKDLLAFTATVIFERDAKVRAFIKLPKTFCYFLLRSYSQRAFGFQQLNPYFLERTAKIRLVLL